MPMRGKKSKSRKTRSRPAWFRYAVTLLALLVLFPVALVLLLRFVDPPRSMVMLARKLEGHTIRYQWVPLERISPKLVETVVTSEDGRFCSHWGVDWEAVGEAIEEAEARGDYAPRGASTISMQTVKNLFLWEGRSYARKAIEIPLTYLLELTWPKRRIIEVYLNVAEWAPGVFGAEAAARHHFRTSAEKLTAAQSARLAASLPNPHVRNAGRPGPRTLRLSRHIAGRVEREGTPIGCIYPNG